MSLKKRVLQTGAAVALSGLFAFSTQSDVDAAEWQPRTVSQIESEIDSQSGEYTFKPGDTLWGISEATGVSVDKLSQINNIEGNMIIAGNSIHLNNNSDVVSVEKGNQVESYDVSDQNVEKTGSSQESAEQEAAEQRAAEQRQAEQEAAEQRAAEQRQAEQEAAEQRAAEQRAAEQRQAEQEAAEQREAQQAQNENQTKGVTTSSNSGSSAKAEIARRESGGSGGYSARNGQYIGKYQLDSEYLNGDHSPANQERVAEQYVQNRYGSWDAALQHHNANNWY